MVFLERAAYRNPLEMKSVALLAFSYMLSMSPFFLFLFFSSFCTRQIRFEPSFCSLDACAFASPLCIILSSFRIFILGSEACLYIFIGPLTTSFFHLLATLFFFSPFYHVHDLHFRRCIPRGPDLDFSTISYSSSLQLEIDNLKSNRSYPRNHHIMVLQFCSSKK